jgi:hypothetical protein
MHESAHSFSYTITQVNVAKPKAYRTSAFFSIAALHHSIIPPYNGNYKRSAHLPTNHSAALQS